MKRRISQRGIYAIIFLVIFVFSGIFGMIPILGIGLGIMGAVFCLYFLAQRNISDCVFWGFWGIVGAVLIFH